MTRNAQGASSLGFFICTPVRRVESENTRVLLAACFLREKIAVKCPNYPKLLSYLADAKSIRPSRKHVAFGRINLEERQMKFATSSSGASHPISMKASDRREHRRHDLEQQGLAVERWDGQHRAGQPLGRIVDISASAGVRVPDEEVRFLRADQQIRVRVALPAHAGISPFVAPDGVGLAAEG